jgi:hypothetical protein
MSKAMAVPFRALMLASGVVLSACGGPMPGETPAPEQPAAPTETVTAEQDARPVNAMDIIPPTSSLSCSRNRFSGAVSCTGSGANGVPPYRYQWRHAYDYETDGYSDPGTWFDGGTTETEYCPFGFHSPGYYWNITLSFRVIDANGYVSTNTPSQWYNCSTPL